MEKKNLLKRGSLFILFTFFLFQERTIENIREGGELKGQFIFSLRRIRKDSLTLLKEFIRNNREREEFEIEELVRQFNLSEPVIKRAFRDLIRADEIPPYLDVLDPNTALPTGKIAQIGVVFKKGYWHGTAHVVLIDEAGRIILRLRGPGISFPNTWDILGTHLWTGENYQDTAETLISSLTGSKIDPERLFKVGREGRFRKIGGPEEKVDRFDGQGVFYYSRPNSLDREFSTLYIYRLSEKEKSALKPGEGIIEFRIVEDIENEVVNMEGNPQLYAPAMRQFFTLSELREEIRGHIVFSFYNLGKIEEFKIIPQGKGRHDRPYKVTSSSGNFVLYQTSMNIEHLRFHTSSLLHFIKNGLPLPRLYPIRENKPFPDNFYVHIGDKYYLAYAYLEGSILTSADPRSLLNENRIRNATRELARWHWNALNFKPLGKQRKEGFYMDIEEKEKLFSRLKEALENHPQMKNSYSGKEFLSAYPLIMESLRKIKTNIFPHIYNFLMDRDKALVIHGDFSRYNLIFNGDEVKGIVDFEQLQLNARLWDIAHWILSSRLDPKDLDMKLVESVITEYQKINHLYGEELIALPEFIRWCILIPISYIADYYKLQGHERYETLLRESGIPTELWGIKLMELDRGILDFFIRNISTLKAIDEKDWQDFAKRLKR
ncbi:MAG: phosphotransferase [Candidatus Omnitrophica bacterium]|nr:phosphotransferase [Candidatus Omnitrophota bacterium]MCM8793898.1 phosphotransferase [Candidatus Omnitrophota bacterium]